MFDRITNYHDDAIEAVYARAAADSRPDRLNLGIGVYRDAAGAVTVMRAVREAEQRLLQRPRPKAYLSPLGNADYVVLMQRLVLGEYHSVLRDARLVAAQGPGAGGMLRVAAELIRSLAPESTVWLSEPVWEHQITSDRLLCQRWPACRFLPLLRSQSRLIALR